MFCRIDHMLNHKNLSPDLTGQKLNQAFFFFLIKKLEISYRKKNGENTNTWRLNNIPLRNQRINEEIKDKIRKHLEINVSETQIYKIYEMQEKQL